MTMSMRVWWSMRIQVFQEQINKLAVNTMVSTFQVRSVCWISMHFKISKKLSRRVFFRDASARLRRAFTPPPRQGSESSGVKSKQFRHSKNEEHLFTQRLGQDVSENHLSSATRRRSFMQLMVCCYQIVMEMISKSKQAAGLFVNVIQVKIHFVQNVHFSQRRTQETQPGVNHILTNNDRYRVRCMLISCLMFCSVPRLRFLFS